MPLFPSVVRCFDRCLRCGAVLQTPPGVQDGDAYWCRGCRYLENARRVSDDVQSPYFNEIEKDADEMLTVNHDEHYPWG